MKPYDYKLSASRLNEKSEENLKILSSIFIYLARLCSAKNEKEMAKTPIELSNYLYEDTQLSPVLKKMSKSIKYSEKLIKDWANKYVEQLNLLKQEIKENNNLYD